MIEALLARAPDGTHPSDLALDRLLAEELEADAVRDVDHHVRSCLSCRRRIQAREQLSAQLASLGPRLGEVAGREPRPGPAPARRSGRFWWPAVAAAVAAAAVALIVAKRSGGALDEAETPVIRTKGPGAIALAFVGVPGAMREVRGQTAVHPGEHLQVTYDAAAPRHAAVLSRDGAGVASIYFPDADQAAPVPAGQRVPLPASTILDDTLGAEEVHVLLCDEPVALEPLRGALAAGRALQAPAGCELETFELVKRRP